MYILLPSGLRLPIPDGLGTVADLKAHLETETGYPPFLQNLFLGRREIDDAEVLASLPPGTEIRFIVAAGMAPAKPRKRLRNRVRRYLGTIFPARKRSVARLDIEAFRAPLEITVGPPDDKSAPQQRETAQHFFDAFETGRQDRLDRIRRACRELDGGPVVVSMFNWGYRQLLENWAASCDRHNIACREFTLLFPTDARADEFARNLGFRTIFSERIYGEIPVEASGEFGDQIFRRILFAKLAMTKDMLDLGVDILRQDIDMVWSRDPRPDLVRRAGKANLDMLFMFDGPNRLHAPLHYNSGFVFIRSNPYSRHAWDVVFSNYLKVLRGGGEQWLINFVMNALHERGLRTGRLPEDIYVNGHVISRFLNDNVPLPDNPAVVHVSWTSDITVKLEHMKRFGFWYLQS